MDINIVQLVTTIAALFGIVTSIVKTSTESSKTRALMEFQQSELKLDVQDLKNEVKENTSKILDVEHRVTILEQDHKIYTSGNVVCVTQLRKNDNAEQA